MTHPLSELVDWAREACETTRASHEGLVVPSWLDELEAAVAKAAPMVESVNMVLNAWESDEKPIICERLRNRLHEDWPLLGEALENLAESIE